MEDTTSSVEPLAQTQPQAPVAARSSQSRSGSSLSTLLLVAAFVVVSVLWFNQTRLSGFDNDWQAVFLTNGQVYFGRVVKQNREEMKVKEMNKWR